MSKQVKLAALPRAESGRNAVKQVRQRGAIPANLYGRGVAPANLEVNRKEVERLLSHAASEHVLVELEIGGDSSRNQLSIIQEVQHHPVSRDILHVDLLSVSATEEITAEVPIEPEGDAVGVKQGGGVLQQLTQAIEVTCLPKDLPDTIRYDVTDLEIGVPVHVSDLKLPNGVTTTADDDLAIFLIAEPKVAEETEDEATPAAPEVISEKKADEEEASEGSEES
ncbi:MAG: 50S ribosomal protein L25 [Chthoniobacterales bacterium]